MFLKLRGKIMDSNRVEVVGHIVILYDSSLEIVVEIACKNKEFAQGFAKHLQNLIVTDHITQID